MYFFTGILACTFLILSYTAYALLKKSDYKSNEGVIVELNSSRDDIIYLLLENRITDSQLMAKIALKIMSIYGINVKVGEYFIPQQASLISAIKSLSQGKKVIRKITISEGLSVIQVIEKLNENELLLGEIKEIPEEGSLMPDTYFFSYPTEKQQIINRAKKMMSDFIAREWPNRSQLCFLKTPEEAVNLASIVEKESFLERELVASVYLNRLKKNMRLQACPTVIYGITKGKPLGRTLLYSDLKQAENLYNTYRHAGLPPTAIANPGRESIKAVLHPAETDYLFFVFDGISRHIFSKNFEDHKKNRNVLRARQKKYTKNK